MTRNIPFQTIISALLDETKPFPAHFLHRFSDLGPADLILMTDAWSQVSSNRKHGLLEDLEDLAEADSLTSFDSLARPLLSDPDSQVRVSAIRLLWECEDLKLIPVYLDLMDNDEHVEVQAAAANALGQFVYLGELDKIPHGVHHKIEDRLLELVTSEKSILPRRRALESLGYSGRAEVIPLIENAYHQKNRDWVVSALFAMGRSCDDRWRKMVLSQLRSPMEDIRSEAIHAAGELEIESARPVLLDLLEDEEDDSIRRQLIWSLSKIGGEGVRAKLEQLLEIESDDAEADFIDEALENLSSLDEFGAFSLLDVSPEVDFIEEEPGKVE